ncbi:hypothetical protein SPRG_10958 [Saprolegnia parasitica CBS 223.65]|uniref:Kazal-like domain-containing protein n=1 Tax=Saprolegnia parasitica (strain CBS 223.65) TaxID=695850 RepID=A0A067BZ74_SAPPC|nr:hypothetical protein SPRG_10958 [Saprolegnia parasitica CBS 223.65]KDO22140.1 hypothetical protein SPRG_10958 [Saprolegnia parasitica CBS 223.65]|eukprot:XP_012207178.1 hypothetical protein SPRG_10958 [Saprolegnia parasitica CBS 223.65]
MLLRCFLAIAALVVALGTASEASCDDASPCPKGGSPVCATNGVTYTNACALAKANCIDANLVLASNGVCTSPMHICAMECPVSYDPQCGSNGMTYANVCEFKKAHCTNPTVTLDHTGRCPARQTLECPSICTMEYAPVCGTDGTTYSNGCKLEIARCRGGPKSTLRIAHVGPCDDTASVRHLDACPTACNDKYAPVCGSDGHTYVNACNFEKVHCGNDDMHIVHRGACDDPQVIPNDDCRDRPCNRMFKPVCGSDNKTYNNMCLFENAQCANRGLALLHDGSCDDPTSGEL